MKYDDNVQKLSDDIESIINKYFPEGWNHTRPTKGIGDVFIGITFGAISKDEVSNGILMNDPCYHGYIIWCDNSKDDKFQIEYNQGGIKVNPRDKFYAMQNAIDSPKLRKYTANAEKILINFEKHIAKVRESWLNNENDIYQRDKYSDKHWSK